ncbi:glycosyltransferase family 4 protein [Paraglaciecola marina]|uniref:glycosyltransferase family 4 protein n=1 Tax=Paraglaciecola marina TaxID=2500157 RepID=UPI00105C996E|nr:glycosyltransferase family 4 protein [Paraglaciecola marina]
MSFKLLMFGQFSPPITGEAVVNDKVFEILQNNGFKLDNVNSSIISNANLVGKFTFEKVFKTANVYCKLLRKLRKVNLMYLTPGQTYLGVIRLVPVLIACRVFNVKVIAHWHGYGLLWLLKNDPIVTRFILNRVNINILLTKHLLEEVELISDAVKNAFVITNYTEVISNKKIETPIKNKDLTIPIRVLYLGSLMKEKGIMIFLQAAQKHPEMNFNICGTGSKEVVNIVKDFSKKLDNLTYSGVVYGNEKTNVLNNADIFVLQSHYKSEGVPLSILEAMSANCAIITTNHNGIPETVGNCALFVEKNNLESLSNKLVYLSENRDVLDTLQSFSHARASDFSLAKFEEKLLIAIQNGLELI